MVLLFPTSIFWTFRHLAFEHLPSDASSIKTFYHPIFLSLYSWIPYFGYKRIKTFTHPLIAFSLITFSPLSRSDQGVYAEKPIVILHLSTLCLPELPDAVKATNSTKSITKTYQRRVRCPASGGKNVRSHAAGGICLDFSLPACR